MSKASAKALHEAFEEGQVKAGSVATKKLLGRVVPWLDGLSREIDPKGVGAPMIIELASRPSDVFLPVFESGEALIRHMAEFGLHLGVDYQSARVIDDGKAFLSTLPKRAVDGRRLCVILDLSLESGGSSRYWEVVWN